MVSRSHIFNETKAFLEDAGVEDFRFDAMCIVEDCLGGIPLARLLMEPRLPVPEDTAKRIREMAQKRAEGVPLQYILGKWEFFGLPFCVGEGVLIPRPDTEVLAENVLDICRRNGLTAPKIADLCSGSGCIAVTLKKMLPQADVYAVELSDKALPYLRKNIQLNDADVHMIEGDVLDCDTARKLEGLDIIVSNPPYLTAQDMRELSAEVHHEPELALFGGDDGLGFYREITRIWRDSLRQGGFIAYEFGIGQHDAVSEILKINSFTNINLSRDAAGIIRTASAQLNTEV